MEKYKHSESMHNLESPNEIVPVIIDLLNPKSVVDIGCGIGTFLHVFKKSGVKEVMGVDGAWVNRNLLLKYINENEFQEANLEQEISLPKKYDLAVSLEVAEHLSESAARQFVKNLVNAGSKIVFSAAIPLQSGQNHINEQWLTYWEKLFNEHNYVLHDVMRPLLWDNPKIFSWYKQNMVLFAPKGEVITLERPENSMRNVIHPDLFTLKAEQAEKLNNPSFSLSLKLLIKSIIGQNVIDRLANRKK